MAHSSLRLGIGRFTTEAEIDLAVDLLEKHVNRCVIRCCTLLHGAEIDAGIQVARDVSPVGDGAGGHRPEEHPVVAGQRPPPLIRFRFVDICVCIYVQ